MVEVKNVTKYYGRKAAVKNLSFNIEDNEILGFLGPNGAGKSTTMNIICGYLPSTSGTVLIDGYDITEDPKEAKKNIGYCPEIPPVYPDMRVKEYMKLCAGIKGIKKSDRAAEVENAMEKLGLTDVSKRLIGNLSKGYRQRVGFAQALLGNPKFLILDEPTAGLDPEQVMEIRELIKSLRKDHTIMLSSHVLSEISAVCERVVIINHGEIIATDSIDHLEKSMQARPVLEVTCEGDTDKVTEVLEEIEGVTRVFEPKFVRTGCYSYNVEMEDSNIRSAILQALLVKNINVLEIKEAKLNLEEVFIKLINQPRKKVDSVRAMLDAMPDESKKEKADEESQSENSEDSENSKKDDEDRFTSPSEILENKESILDKYSNSENTKDSSASGGILDKYINKAAKDKNENKKEEE